MNAAAPAVGSDAKLMPAEDWEQPPGRSASLARLQRSNRSAATIAQKASSSLTPGSAQKAGKSQAEGQQTQPAQTAYGGKEATATAPQSGILRRSRSGSAAGLALPPVTPTHGDLAVEDCLLQRPPSSPPMAMLSSGPLTSGCQELHGLCDASLTPIRGPQRQPTLQQQQLQSGPQSWPVQEEQQQEWMLQKQQQEWVMHQQQQSVLQQQQQEWVMQQQQQQLQPACNVHQQPVAISVDGQLQDRIGYIPGVAHDNPSSLCVGLHPMPPQPQHNQNQQQQQAAVAAQQLAVRTPPDPIAATAAALPAVSSVRTDGKQAATAAKCNGRQAVPPAVVAAANVRSLWGHSKQSGSCTVQQQMVLHQTPHKPVLIKAEQLPSHDVVPVIALQPTPLAAAMDCVCEVDEALQVQKLNVTPHKPPRQLSGNPFAEPAQVQQPTEHVTAQHAQQAQHAVASGHAAELTHHTGHTPTAGTSAQPMLGAHGHPDVMAEHQHGASCMSATVSTLETATGSSQQHLQQASDTQQPSHVASMAESPPHNGERPMPSASVGSLPGQTFMGESQAQVTGAQTGRSLLSDLEVEAVAADAEACLLELQVRSLFTSACHV